MCRRIIDGYLEAVFVKNPQRNEFQLEKSPSAKLLLVVKQVKPQSNGLKIKTKQANQQKKHCMQVQ